MCCCTHIVGTRKTTSENTYEYVRATYSYLAIVEVRITLSVEDHSVVAHHEEIAAHVVQRQEGARHDALSDQREVHRLLDHLVGRARRTGATLRTRLGVLRTRGRRKRRDKMQTLTRLEVYVRK